jgi:hypothetical protein
MKQKHRPLLTLSLLALFLVPGAAGAREGGPIQPAPPIAHCQQLADRVLDMAATNAISRVYPWYHHYRFGLEAGVAKDGASPAGPGHTGTNNQEQGVDEGDRVKTDGHFVYSIRGRDVVIVKVWPARQMRVVGRYQLPENVTPGQLQLRGDRLVVLSSIWEPAEDQSIASGQDAAGARLIAPIHAPPRFAGTRVTVLDIRSKAEPRLVAETDIEGWLAQSRLIGDDLYLVTNSSLRVPDEVAAAALRRARALPAAPLGGDFEGHQELRNQGLIVVRAYLAKRFANLRMNDAMPRTRSRWAGRAMSALAPMIGCHQLAAAGAVDHAGIVAVSHLTLANPTTVQSAAASGGGWQIYASSRAIYVAAPDYGAGAAGSTRILKFALRGWLSRGPAFAASGRVPGHLLNQFAMSEHRGFLRVMTTQSRWTPGAGDQGTNNLFVLGHSGRRLRVVGEVTGLARGERVFAARMFGDKGYMVTFRQTDPLFTFDLSNPYRPRLAGELKINGFSSYIHPIDGDRLLTIGRDADDDGRVKGLHLQIFDVSDPARPRRTHQEHIEGGRYAYSAAQWDHHAFTFDPRTGTLALPISGSFGGSSGFFSGLEVYGVSDRGFAYRGFVTHAGLTEVARRWAAPITRSFVIGGSLVSISDVAIVAASVADPARALASVVLDAAPAPILRPLATRVEGRLLSGLLRPLLR